MYRASQLCKILRRSRWACTNGQLQEAHLGHKENADFRKCNIEAPHKPVTPQKINDPEDLVPRKYKVMSHGPTVIIATPDALRYASPEEVITALTRPPMDILKDDYVDYIKNVLGIAGELYKLLEKDVEMLSFKTKRNDEKCEELSRERKRIDADHTNIMHILDELSSNGETGAFTYAKELEESIRGRYKFCHRALQDIHDELGDLNRLNMEAINRKNAIAQVFYWAREEQAELAKSS